MREGKETLELASELLLLDLFHANLIELFNLKYGAFLLLLSILSGLLGLHLGFLFQHYGRVLILLQHHIMHVEHLPKADVLGVDLLNATSLLGLL